MDSSNAAADIEDQLLVKKLRLDLKEWEQSFAATHQGRKAGREDIKQHPEIGQRHSRTTLQNQLLIAQSTQVQTVRPTARSLLQATSYSEHHAIEKTLHFRFLSCSFIPLSIQACEARSS